MLLEKIDKTSKDIVFVYTICGSIEESRNIGMSSLKEKLAISMDYWVVNSIYPWDNILQEVDQYMLMFSTQKFLTEKLVKHLESVHTYKVPMVVACNTDISNVPYSHWVDNVLSKEAKYLEDDDIHNKKDINSLNKIK